MKRLTLVAVLLVSLLAAGAATAVATTGGSTRPAANRATPPMGSVAVQINVGKFTKAGKTLVATGTAIATYQPKSGKATVVKAPFTADVVATRPAAKKG